jgi:hypothetical protein
MRPRALLILPVLFILFSCTSEDRETRRVDWIGPSVDHPNFDSVGTAELTASECFKLGGSIVGDNSCTETTTGLYAGGHKVGTLTGKYRCRGKGQTGNEGVCVNESVP